MRRYGLKITALLLSAFLVFAIFPSLKSNADMYYVFDSETGTLTISYDGSGDGGITQSAVGFFDRNAVKSVIINDGVTSIGTYAFSSCGKLTSVTIPDSVTSIGDCAFLNCSSLISVTIPDNVTSIGGSAFHGCTSLTSVTIPNSVTSIHGSAFFDCSSLTSVTIPNSVTSIGAYAFLDCSSLSEVVLSGKCDYDSNAFEGCSTDLKILCYYDVAYSSGGHGKITGNLRTYGTDELTLEPDPNYVVDEVVITDPNGGTQSIVEKEGKYYLPVIEKDNWLDGTYEVTASFKLDQKLVEFCSEDGTVVLQSGKIDVTTIPAYNGETPAKPADAQYTYTFAGWSDGKTVYAPTDDLPEVTADATYTAVFSSTTNKYTVTFTDDNGKELQSSEIEYNQVPAYTGDTPAKSEDEQYTYTFAGWTDGTKNYSLTDTLPAVTGAATYKAVFDETAKPEPVVEPDPVVEPKPLVDPKPAAEPEPVEEPKTVLPNDYYVDSIVGDGSQGSIVITVKANGDVDNSFELLDRVEAGGKTLAVGSDIEVNQGSTIITLKKSYIDTLTEGLNSITVYFKDGGLITVNFNVKKAAAAPAANVPATGETMSVYTFVGAGLIFAAVSFAGYNVMKKREEEN